MKISYGSKEGVLTLKLSGELDHHGAKSSISEITNKIESILPRECTLDLSGVTFMDSSGIAVILNTYRRMKEIDGTLSVVNIPLQASRVLKAAGIGNIVGLAGK